MSTSKPKQPKPNSSDPNPYNAPRAAQNVGHKKSLQSPGLLEWIVVFVLGLIAGAFAFFTSCFGAFTLIMTIVEPTYKFRSIMTVLIISICVGAVCGGFAVKLAVRFVLAQLRVMAEGRDSAGEKMIVQKNDGKDSES